MSEIFNLVHHVSVLTVLLIWHCWFSRYCSNSTNILERKHGNIFLMCLIKRILKVCLLPSEKGRYETFRRNIKGFWEHTCGTLTMSREFFHSTINLNYVSYLKCYKWGISVNNLSNLITREKKKKNILKIHSTLDISELIHNNCY
ncbi:hypothetical protein V1477_015722 [Vespula maculifrons]|uniref:Uncharacterized protein n=1 Tax=Vespula maculifrons TaxID=7453 RepID=A0ABD2BAZ2_VESMC